MKRRYIERRRVPNAMIQLGGNKTDLSDETVDLMVLLKMHNTTIQLYTYRCRMPASIGRKNIDADPWLQHPDV